MFQSVKNFLTHRLFTRYGWFYVALVLTAVVSFWGGVRYARSTGSSNHSLASLLDTNIPEWIKTVERHPRKKSLGQPDAPVKVVEYMDIECPYCQRYANKVFPKIVKEFIKTGKVYYTIKHFPLNPRVHPHATMGAVASECAANQSKFWIYKTLAMENRRLQSKNLFLILGDIAKLPDREKFSDCFSKAREIETVRKEKNEGLSNGVQGTPSIAVNGEVIDGYRYETVKKAIQNALNTDSTKETQS